MRTKTPSPASRRHRSVPEFPRRSPVCKALSDAGDPHFLAWRRGGGNGEQVLRQPIGLCPTLLRGSLNLGPPRRRQHRRDREHHEQHERRVNRRQQRHRHAQPQDPPERGKQRHVHVVEHEHLIAQHGQPIEILRTLLMRDRRDRSLQLRDVRFERDGHLIAEAALHARADRAQKPRPGGRHAETNRRALYHPGLCSRTPLPSSISHNARSASGSAASCDSTNAATIRRGSWRYPSLHNRHIDDSAGGSGRSRDRDQERTS
jgi:hypothetical protein